MFNFSERSNPISQSVIIKKKELITRVKQTRIIPSFNNKDGIDANTPIITNDTSALKTTSFMYRVIDSPQFILAK